jgi:hypothetical protein
MNYRLTHINTMGYANLQEVQLYKIQLRFLDIVEITIGMFNLVVFAEGFGS